MGKENVTFRLEDGRTLDMNQTDPQLRHLDRAWASTGHAFLGRTVDKVIAVLEASHPHVTTQNSFYVEISRTRRRAELVTDDRKALGEHLDTATGERMAALEALAPEAGRAAAVPELTVEDAGKVTLEPVESEAHTVPQPISNGVRSRAMRPTA